MITGCHYCGAIATDIAEAQATGIFGPDPICCETTLEVTA